MSRHRGPWLLLIALLVVANCTQVYAQSSAGPYVQDEVILKFDAGISALERSQILYELGATPKQQFNGIQAELHTISKLTVQQAVDTYAGHPQIRYIEPNYILEAVEIPNDPSFDQLWGLRNTGQTGGTAGADISAENAWDVVTGSADVIIGVIDSGTDYTHADLAANIFINPGEIANNGLDDDNNGFVDDVRGWDFVNNDNDPMDDAGHGTHVAGTVGAVGNNSIGVVGVNWTVRIMPVKFLDAFGFGSTADAIASVEYCTLMGVHLTNNSWGGGSFSVALGEAIENAGDAGILFVAAAGNSGVDNDNFPHYPSSYDLDNIVAVAATNHNDALASFSNYGVVSVDLAAPGVDVLSTIPGNGYTTANGTSMASPHVAGALGLIFARFPNIGAAEAKALVLNSVDPIAGLDGRVLTGGRLNAFLPIADPDSTPPAPISDLMVTGVDGAWMDVSWTSTGDDSTEGTASSYVVRYATFPITEDNFDDATLAMGAPDPLPSGSPQTMRIEGLNFSTNYFVAIQARDEFGNPSSISNVVDATTLPPPDIAVSPTSMSADLLTGASETQLLLLDNSGPSELTFDVSFRAPVDQTFVSRARVFKAPARRSNARPSAAVSGPRSTESYDAGQTPRRGVLTPDQIRISQSTQADLQLLIVQSGGNVSEIRNLLLAFPDIVAVDEFNAGSVAPTLNDLLPYDAVVVVSNTSFADPVGVGDALADFADTGGGVIMTLATFVPAFGVQGRFVTDGYAPLENGAGPIGGSGLGSFNAAHPIMDGVSAATGDLLASANLASGAELVADWSFGQPFVAVKGTNVVAINVFFGSPGFWTGDVPLLVRNAAAWSSNAVTWLSAAPETGSIPGGESLNIAITFDATGLNGGDYSAEIVVDSNDPDESEVVVAAQLHVTGAPDIDLSTVAIDFGAIFVGATKTDTLVVSNPGTDLLTVSSLLLDDTTNFSVSPSSFALPPGGDQIVELSFTPSVAQTLQATLLISSDDPDENFVTVSLDGVGLVPPDIGVAPDSLNEALFTGETSSQTLTISNTGGSDLFWTASTAFTTKPQLGLGNPVRRATGVRREFIALRPPDSAGEPAPAHVAATPLTDFTFQDNFEDGNFDGWLLTSGTGTKEVTNATAANGTQWSYHEFNSPSNSHFSGIYQDFGAVQPTYAGFWVRSSATSNHDGYFVLRSSTALETIWFYMTGEGYLYVNGNVGGNESVPYTADTWYHIEFKDIDFTAKHFDYYVDGVLVQEDIPFRNAGSVQDFGRLDIYSFSGGSSAWWDEFFISTQEPAGWLSLDPQLGTVPAGASAEVTVTFDATGLIGGDYFASAMVFSNDPDEPQVAVPAHLNVTGAPDIELSSTSFDFGPVFIGGESSRTLVVTNTGTDVLIASDLSVDDDTNFDVGPTSFELQVGESLDVTVTFAPTTPTLLPASLTILSNDPDESSVVVSLQGTGVVPPDISVTPDSLSEALLTGQMSDQTITISNSGPTALTFSIFSQPVDLTQAAVVAHRADRQLSKSTTADYRHAYEQYRQRPPDAARERTLAEPVADPRLLRFYERLRHEILADSFVVFFDDMESGDNGWSHYATHVNNIDQWSQTTTRAHSGSTSWNVSQHSSFGADALQSPPIDLTQFSDLTLAFHHWYNFDDCGGDPTFEPDGGIVEVSIDGGSNWTQIFPVGGYPYVLDDICSNPLAFQPAYSHDGGNGSAFVPALFDLTPFAGEIVTLRFHAGWDCGNCGSNEGWYVDDVTVFSAGAVWLSVDPSAGTVPPGGDLDVTVTFDASGLNGGDYFADVVISSNDPDEPEVAVATHLNVTGAPDISLSITAFDFGSLFLGLSVSETLLVTNVGTDLLTVSSLSVNHADFAVDNAGFSLSPGDAREVAISFTPSTAAVIQGMLTIQSDDPDESEVTVALMGVGVEPPDISVSPDSLDEALFTGESSTQFLTIANSGGSDLDFEISIEAPLNSVSVNKITLQASIPAARKPGRLAPIVLDPEEDPGQPSEALGPFGPLQTDFTFEDDFEDGDFDGWLLGSGAGNKEVTNATAANGTQWSYHESNSPSGHFTGIYQNFSNVQPVYVGFWVRSSSTGNHDGYFVLRDGNNRFPIFFFMRGTGFLYVNADVGGSESIPYEANTWYHIEFKDIDFAADNFDYYVNGMLVQEDIAFRGAGVIEDFVRLDLYSFSGGASAWWDEIFVSTQEPAGWLSADPLAGTVPPGTNAQVAVTFDATGLNGGDYFADIVVDSNDPDKPETVVPTHLHVTGAPDIVVSETALDFGTVFVGASLSEDVIVSNPGTDLLVVTNIDVDNSAFSVDLTAFDLAPGETQVVVVGYNPQTPGTFNGTVTIESNDPDESQLPIQVSGAAIPAPEILVDPPAVVSNLVIGESETQIVTVSNTGGSDLDFTIHTALGADSIAVQETVIYGKNDQDPRVGDPVAQGSGGPDLFGYRWIDSDEPGGPVFDWVEIAFMSTPVVIIGDDQNSGPLPIGFDFPFYGNTFDTFNVCTNGWVSFTSTRADFSNQPLPSSGAPENLLSVFWDDLFFPTLNAWYLNDGTRLIIEYSEVPHLGSGGPYTFQIILYPDGRIVYQYLTMNPPTNSATIGIQNDAGNDGLQVVFNQNYVHDNLAIEFRMGPQWLSVAPTAGIVPPGGSVPINVTIDATDLVGVFHGALDFLSNDPVTPLLTVPVTLHAQGIPEIDVNPSLLHFGTVFVDYAATMDLTVNSTGTDTLTVTDITIDDPDYSVDVTAFDLPPGASQVVEVTLLASSTGSHAATLQIQHNADGSPSAVTLDATALIAPQIDLVPANLEGAAPPGGVKVKTLQVCNTGGSDLHFAANATHTPGQVVEPYAYVELEKGQEDPRPGILGSGGPDAFGYTWIDSDEVGGPVFGWVDIRDVGTLVPLTGDDRTSAPLPIGFDFRFYGNTFDTVRMCTNGWVSFTYTAPLRTNQPLPSSASPTNLLAVFWDDLVVDAALGGEMHYHNDGSRLILQYSNLRRFGESAPHYTFQILLYPSGLVVYQYLELGPTTTSATIGIQNQTGRTGLTVVFNDDYVRESMAVALQVEPTWLSVEPSSGNVPAGECAELQVRMDAADLESGDYLGSILVTSNDPDDAAISSNVTFHVGIADAADVEVTPQTLNAGSEGNWITARVELPPEYDPADVVLSTVRCMGSIAPDSQTFSTNEDFNNNGIPDVQLKFDRRAVAQILPVADAVEIVITGEILDTIYFDARDTIAVIRPRLVSPNGGESVSIGSQLTIVWETPTDWNVDHADLYYTMDEGASWAWSPIATGIQGQSYDWTVPDESTETARVRVVLYDSEGVLGVDTSDEVFSIGSEPTDIAEPIVPKTYALLQNFPNPFNPTTQLRFDLPRASDVRLEVFDVTGRLVSVLVDEWMPAGRHSVVWYGQNRQGTRAASGVYFYRIRAGEFSSIRRMLMLK